MSQLADPSPPRATYTDIENAPPGTVAEIVDGALYLQAQPAPPHGDVQDGLIELLRPPFQRGRGGPGGWWVRSEPELHVPGTGDVLVPDLGGWRQERLPEFPATWRELKVMPDWVCEILSPSTRSLDLIRKRPAYGAAGIPWLWLIDPLARTLEVFRNRDGEWSVVGAYEGEADAAVPPFEAVPLSMQEVWGGVADRQHE